MTHRSEFRARGVCLCILAAAEGAEEEDGHIRPAGIQRCAVRERVGRGGYAESSRMPESRIWEGSGRKATVQEWALSAGIADDGEDDAALQRRTG